VKTYQIAVRFAFDGEFIVRADRLSEAKQKVSDGCGLVLGGGIHTTLPEEEIDWEFPVHPNRSILRARRILTKTNYRGKKTHGKLS
jgi:hypothetical protein